MNTLKDILSKFREQFVSKDKDFGQEYTGGTPKLVEEFWTTAIQEALESLQGEERDEINDGGYVDDNNIGWNAREKKLREDSAKFLGK